MTDLTALDHSPDDSADTLTILAPRTVGELHRRALAAHYNSPLMQAKERSDELLSTAWWELRGYLTATAELGCPVEPGPLLAYVERLHRAGKKPVRDWIDRATGRTPKDGAQ